MISQTDQFLTTHEVCLYSYVASVILLLLSNQKQPSCKKKGAAPRKAMVKKDVKSKVTAKKWL